MMRLLPFWILSAFLAGCRPGLRNHIKTEMSGSLTAAWVMEDAGSRVSLTGIKHCRYPVNDPLFEKKKNRKLVLMQVQVQCVQNGNRAFWLPGGATLTDNRGNEYESSPAVIAMAQTGHCINDDDISAYNAIWNGGIRAGESYTAWVLGFELPGDAEPVKLYWNTAWKKDELFFRINNPETAVNH